jgi:multiple sugar transport system substrate-binding protein
MRIPSKLFALGAAAIVVAACSSSSASPGATASTSAASAPPVTASFAYPTEKVSLNLWWWGEQEAPGATKYLNDAIAAYEKLHPNVTITPTLQTNDGLVPGFAAAAAAKSGPDIEYFWGGTNALQPAWNGWILPVSDYIPASELKHYLNGATEEGYQGKIWAVPWYVEPSFPMLVRKSILAQYSLTVPSTWSDLMNVCDVLSSHSITTIAGGVSDAWLGGWLYSVLGAQSLSSTKDVINAVIGKKSFQDADQAGWWTALAQSVEHHCWNSDIGSLQQFEGQQRWKDGKAAMTFASGSDAPNIVVAQGGTSAIAQIATPAWSNGRYAGKMGTTSQTLGITSWTKYPQVCADFLMFLHTTDQLNAWFADTGAMPADDRFDLSQVTEPAHKALFDMVLDGGPYLENFIPVDLDTGGVFKNVQLILAGSETAAQAAADMDAVAARLRTTDRSLVTNFTNWGQ